MKYSGSPAAIQLQTNIIDSMFHLISLPHGKKLNSPTLHEYMGDLLVLTWMHCLRSALFFKHEAYSNEAEYRFLQVHMAGPHPASDVKYRTKPYELVRYREFDLAHFSVQLIEEDRRWTGGRQAQSGNICEGVPSRVSS